MIKISKSIISLSFLVIAAISCNKNKLYDTATPPEQAHFMNVSSGTYQVLSTTTTYKVKVGLTTVSTADRTVGITVTSPTGAVQGTHYTLSKSTLTIPAGQTIDSLNIQGAFNLYTAGRKDTLVLTITEPGVKPSEYNNKLTLLMRGPCFDGEVTSATITSMGGNFTKTFENGSYGPYTTSISSITSTGATTARGRLNNLYDSFGPVDINFDWTDPMNTKAEIPLQITNLEYAPGQPFYVRTKPGSANKFSFCNNNLSFTLDVLVLISGSYLYYDNGVVYTMGR